MNIKCRNERVWIRLRARSLGLILSILFFPLACVLLGASGFTLLLGQEVKSQAVTQQKKEEARMDFPYLPPEQRRLAQTIYATISSDNPLFQANEMLEFAGVISRKFPNAAIPLYETSFDLTHSMPQEIPTSEPDIQVIGKGKSWDPRTGENLFSKVRVQCAIVRTLVEVNPARAKSLFLEIQKPLTVADASSLMFKQSIEPQRPKILYRDSEVYYRTAFFLGERLLESGYDEAVGLVSKAVPETEFASFEFLPRWVSALRKHNPVDSRAWSINAFKNLSQMPIGEYFKMRQDIPQPLEGLKQLVTDTAANDPASMEFVVDHVLKFSEQLWRYESGQAGQFPGGPQGWTLGLLQQLEKNVAPLDPKLAGRIAARLKDIPPIVPQRVNNTPNRPTMPDDFKLRWNSANRERNYLQLETLLTELKDPRTRVEIAIQLAQDAMATSPEVAARFLRMAEAAFDVAFAPDQQGNQTFESWTVVRLIFLFRFVELSARLEPEGTPGRIKRLIEEYDVVRSMDGAPFDHVPTIKRQYTQFVAWLVQNDPQDAEIALAQMNDVRMRIQVWIAMLNQMLNRKG